jgi:membrane protease YdiL (CAAX protease family)
MATRTPDHAATISFPLWRNSRIVKLDNRGIHVSIVVVMLIQICSLFVREYFRLVLNNAGFSEPQSKHLSALVGFLILALLMWPILRDTWPALRTLFDRPRYLLRTVLAAIGIAILLWVINAIVLLLAATLSWTDPLDRNFAASPVYFLACENPEILILAIPVISRLTPLIEETINRGLILHTLLPKGKWLAIIVSAALFMALHIGATYPTAFLFGIVAAIQILVWKNIWGVIITHGTFNLIVVIDQVCLGAYWVHGKLAWDFGSPLQVSATALLLATYGVYRLLNAPKAWTTQH